MAKLFSENIESLDFQTDPESSRGIINKFVSDVTRGNINDLLVPGAITDETKLVMANAAYFKGQWSSKFDPEETKPRIFYDFGPIPVYVDMMKQRGYSIMVKATTRQRSEFVATFFSYQLFRLLLVGV